MSVNEARQLFLMRISQQLAEEGHPLCGFQLLYWRALASEDEIEVQDMWKQKEHRKELDAADKEFERALVDALRHDLSVSSGARERYLTALDEIKSLNGVQLQALVFAAAVQFKELTPSSPWVKWVKVGIILFLLGIGAWIGLHLQK